MQIKARHTVITITSVLCLASFLISPRIFIQTSLYIYLGRISPVIDDVNAITFQMQGHILRCPE